jgi:hypothetical protein
MKLRENPRFPPRYVCVSPGCPKGVFPRLRSEGKPLDLSSEQIRTKIQKLLALASSAYLEEADTARRMAEMLSEKYGLKGEL